MDFPLGMLVTLELPGGYIHFLHFPVLPLFLSSAQNEICVFWAEFADL